MITLSDDQQAAVNAIRYWLGVGNPTARRQLVFGGLAGTGKTTIVAALPGLLNRDILYCAPTGKAARVLTSKLPDGVKAGTIHGLIYSPDEKHCEDCPTTLQAKECHATSRSRCGCAVAWWKSGRRANGKLVVVDEASMIDERLYDDLMENISPAPVLFVGDHGQLPPVGTPFNLMENPDVRLERIHRQAEGSAILQVAAMARTTGHIPYKTFGEGVFKVAQNEAEIDFDDESLLLCYTNANRVSLNNWIRELRGLSGPPQVGERVICLRNNWRRGIYNGLGGTITELGKGPMGKYEAAIALEDGGVYTGIISSRQFGQPNTLLNDFADQFDFGYCLTVHKAQGSQAEHVIVFEERLPWISEDDWRRWLYTAVTRAVSRLTIIA